jgi:Domain of unknown function (DUF4357)
MSGKEIRLYIMGEDKKGLKSVELSNWTGKAYIGDRKHSKIIQDIDELSSPGLYFLINEDNDSMQKNIYIGEADEVNKRIQQHISGKDWWEQFVVFISKDANLTKAHVRYLEKQFFLLAKTNTTSFNLKNSSEPPGSRLPQADIDVLNTFLENIVFCLNNLGIINFANSGYEKEQEINDNEIFYLNLTNDRKDENGNTLQARLIITNNGYRLLKGSFVESIMRESFQRHIYYPLRNKLNDEKVFDISNYPEILITNKDLDFTAPSPAASIVKYRATNGPKEWHLKNGKTLDDYESQK